MGNAGGPLEPEEIQGHGPATPREPHTQPNVLIGKSNPKAVTKFCSLTVPIQQCAERQGETQARIASVSFWATSRLHRGSAQTPAENILWAGLHL